MGAGICVGSTYTPVNATISQWFVAKRALALGIAIMGITVGLNGIIADNGIHHH
jgi:MFS family permease